MTIRTTRLQVPIDALPGNVKPHEHAAVVRWLNGQHLGTHAAKSARAFRRKVEKWRRSGGTLDLAKSEMDARRASFPGKESGSQAPAGSHARPGAATPWAAPRAPGDRVGTPGAGGTALPRRGGVDARQLSGQQYRDYLASRGLDGSFYEASACCEGERLAREAPPTSVVVAQRRRAAEAAEVREQRSAQLEAGRIDASDPKTTPEQIKARLEQLFGPHRDTPLIDESFRAADGRPLAPPDYGPDHTTVEQAARRRAAKAAAVVAKGGRVDARQLDPATVGAYAARRGFSWPGSGY